jgi:hypothetical protein
MGGSLFEVWLCVSSDKGIWGLWTWGFSGRFGVGGQKRLEMKIWALGGSERWKITEKAPTLLWEVESRVLGVGGSNRCDQ